MWPLSWLRARRTSQQRRRVTGACLQLEALESRCVPTAGVLDPTFSGDGLVTTTFFTTGSARAEAVAVYPETSLANDGKIVAVGSANGYFAMARYLPDGTLDTSFSGDGKATTTSIFYGLAGYTQDVALLSNDKILVVGTAQPARTTYDFALVRFNADGSLDMSFGNKGKVTTNFLGSGRYASQDYAAALVVQADGKILVAGFSEQPTTGSRAIALARYNSNGTLDTTFDGDGKVRTAFPPAQGAYICSVTDMTITADGKIVVVGMTRALDWSHYDAFVARYNPDGSLDASFGQGGFVTLAPKAVDQPASEAPVSVAV